MIVKLIETVFYLFVAALNMNYAILCGLKKQWVRMSLEIIVSIILVTKLITMVFANA